MTPVAISNRWTILMPEHRVPQWERWQGLWEAERLASMYDLLEPGQTVVDVGAEHGDFTALYASWGCHVVPMEPSPWYWPTIRAMIEANGLRDLVASCWVGFASDVSNPLAAEPTVPPYIWPAEAMKPVNDKEGFCTLRERPDIPRITIDDMARETGIEIDAMTIDVEGAELMVLRGAAETLLTRRPKVWVSVHPDFMRDSYRTDPIEVERFMEGFGYVGELLADRHEQHYLYLPV